MTILLHNKDCVILNKHLDTFDEFGAKATLLMQMTSPTFSSTFCELNTKGVFLLITFPKNMILYCWFGYALYNNYNGLKKSIKTGTKKRLLWHFSYIINILQIRINTVSSNQYFFEASSKLHQISLYFFWALFGTFKSSMRIFSIYLSKFMSEQFG